MVGGDGLVGSDKRGKSPGQERNLLEQAVVDCRTRQSNDIIEGSPCPVVDDEQRQHGSADGIKPPDIQLMTDQWEQKRQGVEEDVGLAIFPELVRSVLRGQ